jgi:putative Holliday junction resolvase
MGNASDNKRRVLSIDPGTKRIGLAVSDPLGMTAQGIETFETGPGRDFLDHVRALIERYSIGTVVVGLPLSMQGTDIEGSERSRALAAEIHARFRVEVVLQDERMTSLEAERILQSGDRSYDRGDIDKLSAVLLLQSHLDERPKR